MALLEAKLKHSLETGSLMRLYMNEDDLDSFEVVTILALDDERFLASSVDVAGRFDGFLYSWVENIVRCGTGGAYCEALARTSLLNPAPGCPFTGELSLERILTFLRESKNGTWVKDTEHDHNQGFIVNFDDSEIEMAIYDTTTLHYNCNEVIKIEDIVSISFGGPDQFLLDNLLMPNL